MIYLIGSLASQRVLEVAKILRSKNFDVFDDWMAASPDGDTQWQAYGRQRGWTYKQALESSFVTTAFNFDFDHLQKADTGVLIMPAGRSGHLELGWLLGQGKKGYIMFDGEPERYDLMTKLATNVVFSVEELITELQKPEEDPVYPLYDWTEEEARWLGKI
jgi:hypothetical protein